MGPCNRDERRIHAKKREGVSIVKREKRGGEGVYKGTAEEEIHTTLCRKEGWEEEDGPGL